MQENDKLKIGFYLATLYNFIGILGFNAFFMDDTLSALNPVTFSLMGQIGILLWGLAYFSVAKTYARVPLLLGVFCAEKLIYFLDWAIWLAKNGERLSGDLPIRFKIFFYTYGLGDLTFGVFFAIAALSVFKNR